MTCRHVIDIIDAGPFVDVRQAPRRAALDHARQCIACGAALERAADTEAQLRSLARPAPPPDLRATVMAGLSRIDDVQSGPAAAPDGSWFPAEWWPGVLALGGLSAGIALVLSMPTADLTAGLGSVRFARMTSGLWTLPSAGMLALAGGLVLYVAGLFASLRGRTRNP